MDVSAQEEKEFTLPPPFCPVIPLVGLDDASQPMWVRMSLFYSVYWVKHESFLEIPSTDMPRNTILSVSWAFLSPEKLTLKMNLRRSVHTGTAPTWKDFLPSASRSKLPRILLSDSFPLHSRSWCSVCLSTFGTFPWLIFSFFLPLQS